MTNLFDRDFVIFRTRDYALASGRTLSAASRKLAGLEKEGFITKLTKGVWANSKHPWFDARACVPYLLDNEQGYVSFLTILHDKGVLSQIPKAVQVATSGHGRQLHTPVGDFEFIQIKPELMQDGIVWSNTHLPFMEATAEKALMDCLYVSTRKGKRFASMPELDMDEIDIKRLNRLIHDAAVTKSIRKSMEKQLSYRMA